LLTGTGIGTATISHQRHCSSRLQLLLRPDYRCRLDPIGGKYGCCHARHLGKKDAQVEDIFSPLLNPGISSAGTKPPGRGNTTRTNRFYLSFHYQNYTILSLTRQCDTIANNMLERGLEYGTENGLLH
jgi:hypothetical protein